LADHSSGSVGTFDCGCPACKQSLFLEETGRVKKAGKIQRFEGPGVGRREGPEAGGRKSSLRIVCYARQADVRGLPCGTHKMPALPIPPGPVPLFKSREHS